MTAWIFGLEAFLWLAAALVGLLLVLAGRDFMRSLWHRMHCPY